VTEAEAIAAGYEVTRPAVNGDAVQVYDPDYGISATGGDFASALAELFRYESEEDDYAAAVAATGEDPQ
jgi:hypothetical protein